MRLLAPLLLLAAASAAAAANDTLGKGFILASSGATCASTCESAGKKLAKFSEFNSPAPAETAVCAGKASDKEGWVPGWQAVGGDEPTACHVALNLNATSANADVACLCLDGGEVQGLDLPKGKPCSKACAKSITGRKGRPIAASTATNAGYACLSLPTEIGVLNRFGHTHKDGSCRTSIQNNAVETDAFACFCVFEGAAEPGALAANAQAAKQRAAAAEPAGTEPK